MSDFNSILKSALKEYGIFKPCPIKWKVHCNQCRGLLENPEWCVIVMGRAIRGKCPIHGEVEFSIE